MPSQKGALSDRPHRQSAYFAGASYTLPRRHFINSPSALAPMISSVSGALPETMSAQPDGAAAVSYWIFNHSDRNGLSQVHNCPAGRLVGFDKAAAKTVD